MKKEKEQNELITRKEGYGAMLYAIKAYWEIVVLMTWRTFWLVENIGWELRKQSDADDLKNFCRSIAQYKNQISLSILIALTRKETYPDSFYLAYNKEYVFRAIYNYYSPLYQKIYKELKPEMSEYILDYLGKPDYEDYTTW